MFDTNHRPASFITPEGLLEHWQGHRRLTRRVIAAFPEDALFTFGLGGMRPFGMIAHELIGMAAPMVRGLVEDVWTSDDDVTTLTTKATLLARWDRETRSMDELWPRIPAARFQATSVAFGQYEGTTCDLVLYVIDNEVHHRGQGYVYLRALGLGPPAFWERD